MTGYELYQIAKKHIGEGGAKARAYCGMKGGAWCNAYVCYIFGQGGVANLYYSGKKVTYCPTSIKWCEANLAQIPMYLAMPMDVIYFDWQPNGRPDHIGFVKARKSSSEIFTHEGNTSGGKVAEKTRPAKYVEGVFRPHFTPMAVKKEKLALDGAFEYQSIYVFQLALGVKADGILGKGTVKAWQKLIGVPQDGAWGRKTTLAAQKFLKVKQDGAWGKDSTIALQKWCNAKVFPSQSVTQPSTETKPTTPVVKQGYSGAFPDLVTHSGQIIAYTARDLAYAKGTKKATYTYPKGKAKATFTKAINKVYPKRSSWSKQCQAGASCDVGAGTILRYAGIDTKVPRGLQEQLTHFKKSSLWKNTGLKKCSLAGDVAMQPSPSAHIWIGLGDGNIAEANHTWKFFEHIVKDTRKINGKAKSGVYRCTKSSPIKKGDRGTEVKKLQAFLNWAGYNCGTADGVAGDKTDSAIRAFQKANGLTVDGQFGNGSLAKAKAVKK